MIEFRKNYVRELIFSYVKGENLANLLKINSFTVIFQGF